MKKFVVLIIISCGISCEKNKENDSSFVNNKYSVSISLPNTIKVNEELNGLIEYKSDFDTITKSFTDTTNFKTPYFYIYQPQENDVDMNNLVIRDSFKLWSNKIEVNNFWFSKKGSYNFLAMIKDEIMLFSYKENGKTDSIRILSNQYFIHHKIQVTD